MLKLFNKSIKSLCLVPTVVHHSLLIDKEIGVSICNDNFCLCDNMIKKIIEEQQIKMVTLTIKQKDDDNQPRKNTKCD